MPTIKFTDVTGTVPEKYYPKPSKAFIPEWLKKLQPYFDDGGETKQTGKRCIPMLDAVMSGYTIVISEDIEVSQTITTPSFKWASGRGIEFHVAKQMETHPRASAPIPKWNSPWSIETPNGYSCLFVSPLNSQGLPFLPFSAVVDTDTYVPVVNFPFLLSDPSFQGLVPAGTPIMQVFPFKRESWRMEVEVGETRKLATAKRLVNSVFKNGYRNNFWSKKDYS